MGLSDYEQALKEAYASAPTREIIHDTLEIRHPAFSDDDGQPTAIRVVRGYENIITTLEADAPMHGGQAVEFIAGDFDFRLPGYKEGETPQLEITLDNVSREVTAYLEMAIGQTAPIEVTYRPYLASDLTAPQVDPPISMILTKVNAGVMQVRGTATLSDVHNWPFPNTRDGIYRPERFPGLLR